MEGRKFACVLVGAAWLAAAALPAGAAGDVSAVSLPLGAARVSDARVRIEGEPGQEALTWEGPADESFELAFDWPAGVSPADYDLIVFDGAVLGGRGGFVASVTHPGYQKGFKAVYYAVDRPPTAGPAPVHLDLHMPECFEDLAATNPPGFTLSGLPRRTGAPSERQTRTIRISNVRMIRRVLSADWDQVRFRMGESRDGSVRVEYPVELRSFCGEPVTVAVRLQHLDVRAASCSVEPAELRLEPGGVGTVTVTLALPPPEKDEPPLYTERVLFWAEVKGRPETAVSILRSNDFLPLTVTRPLGSVPDAPVLELHAPPVGAQKRDEVLAADDLLPQPEEKERYVKDDWMVPWWQIHLANARTIAGLVAGFLKSGDSAYAEAAKKFMLQYAERAPLYPRIYFGCGLPAVCCSSVGHSTLETSWFFNDFLPAFDILRARGVLTPSECDRIVKGFLLPEAVIFRNQNVGLNNMQIESNSRVFYIGMLTGNWPLAAFAYNGLCGFTDQVLCNFSADGWAFEGHYYGACVDPLTQQAALLDTFGVPAFDRRFQRIFEGAVSKAPFWHCTLPMGAFRIAAAEYGKPLYAELDKPAAWLDLPSASMPSHGFACLRRNVNGRFHALGMNWGCQEMRGAPDRMGIFISSPYIEAGRAIYSHNSIDQATIVVDGDNQTPLRGSLDQFVPDGPAAIVAASNDRLYAGVTIYRTAVSLDNGAFVVIDRCASDAEHTYDWPGTGMPRPGDLAFAPRENALGTAHGYEGFSETATVDNRAWGVRDDERAILVLPWPETLVAVKKHAEAWRGTTVLYRLQGAVVDAGVAYVPAGNGAAVDFSWKERGGDRAVALLRVDGAEWTVALDYAAPPDRRCRVSRRTVGDGASAGQ